MTIKTTTAMTKVQLIHSTEHQEITVVCDDGGIAVIRAAEPTNPKFPRLSTTDYYQRRLTQIPKDAITDEHDVWANLGEGSMHYSDWKDKPYNNLSLLEDALNWLGHSLEDSMLVDEVLFPDIVFAPTAS